MNVVKSLFYLVALLVLFYNLMRVEKSQDKKNGYVWIIINVMIVMWLNILVAGILSIIKIPVNILTIGFVYLIMSCFVYFASKQKQSQRYFWDMCDFILMLLIILIAVIIGIWQHQSTMQIAYYTSDPAVHLGYAVDVLKTDTVTGMYGAALNNSLFIELLSPFFEANKYYKIFILADILMFAYSGLCFYSIVRDEYETRNAKVFATVFALIYMFGYPLNNKIYGFVYLGISISAIAILYKILGDYIKDIINKRYAIILLMLGCNAVVLYYMLFAPVVYVTVFIVLIHSFNWKVFSKDNMRILLVVFVLPCLMALYYCLYQFFVQQKLDITTAIAAQGGIYSEAYSNFVFFLPLVICFLLISIREHKHFELTTSIIVTVIVVVIMFIFTMKDYVSIYYFSKMAYLLWLIFCWTSVFAIIKLLNTQRDLLIGYLGTIGILVLLWLGNVNGMIVEKYRTKSCYTASDGQYFSVGFDIYSWNYLNLKYGFVYDKEKMKLFNYVYDNLYEKKTEIIPVFVDITNFTDAFWYDSILQCDTTEYAPRNDGDVIAYKIFEKKSVEYAILINGNPYNEIYANYIQQCEVVYETDAGKIIRIQ